MTSIKKFVALLGCRRENKPSKRNNMKSYLMKNLKIMMRYLNSNRESKLSLGLKVFNPYSSCTNAHITSKHQMVIIALFSYILNLVTELIVMICT